MALEAALQTPLAEAVRAAGSQSAFARIIGRRQSTVHHWLKHGCALPAENVLTVEAATGISRHQLRPDIYPLDPASPASPPHGLVVEPGAPVVACDRGAPLHRGSHG